MPFELIGIAVMREFNIVITAVLLAGRSASSFAAEIGAMKMNQEIDAMRTLGIDPMDTLVLPRVLAASAHATTVSLDGTLVARPLALGQADNISGGAGGKSAGERAMRQLVALTTGASRSGTVKPIIGPPITMPSVSGLGPARDRKSVV